MSETVSQEALLPCPFCGGHPERFTIGDEEPNNAGGDVIVCTRCQASSHVEFGRKENLVSRWNTRTPAAPSAGLAKAAKVAEDEEATWTGDDPLSTGARVACRNIAAALRATPAPADGQEPALDRHTLEEAAALCETWDGPRVSASKLRSVLATAIRALARPNTSSDGSPA